MIKKILITIIIYLISISISYGFDLSKLELSGLVFPQHNEAGERFAVGKYKLSLDNQIVISKRLYFYSNIAYLMGGTWPKQVYSYSANETHWLDIIYGIKFDITDKISIFSDSNYKRIVRGKIKRLYDEYYHGIGLKVKIK